MVTSGNSHNRPPRHPSHVGARVRNLENIDVLLPIPLGFAVGVVSILVGASPGYAALQMMLFALLCPLFFVLKFDDRYTAGVILVSFVKIYFLSQLVCVLLLRAPDAHLMRPVMTEIAIGVGLAAAVAGIGAAALLFAAIPPKSALLRIKPDAYTLRRFGYPVAVVGLAGQAIWTVFLAARSGDQASGIGGTISGIVVFGYLSPLAILAICCFAAARLIETRGKRLVSREFVAVLLAYIALIAPLATKAEPLKPIVAIAALAFIFRWRPSAAMVASALFAVVFVAEFLYPTITLARMRAFGERRPLPVVFAETVVNSVVDPSELAFVKAYTKSLDREGRASYYGQPTGFLDRFTPRVTDLMVTQSEYNEPVGWVEFSEGAKALLPQSLGFKRDVTLTQRRIEAAVWRKADRYGKVSWENSGFVGGGYLAGGLGMVAAYLFAFAFLSSLVARVTFGTNGGVILWIPFLIAFMLYPADTTLAGGAPIYAWGWAVLAIAIAVLLKVYVSEKRSGIAVS